jgi:2-keto-4-pentenoate hydratase
LRSRQYSRSEISGAVGALVPAIEIVSPRFRTLSVTNVPQLVADYCANGGAVLGTPCTDWRGLGLPSHSASLFLEGTLRQQGTGNLVLGNPLNVLEWFVVALAQRGKSIEPGQFVMTGTMTGLHAIERGQTATSDFGTLGVVEVAFM